MAAEQTTLSLPPAPPAPTSVTESVPSAPAPPTAHVAQTVTGIPSLKDKIAGAIAAGTAAAKVEAAESAPAPAPSADPVADVPAPPVVEPAKEAPASESQPDPMAAFAARFEALEKQNATLLEQLAKLTAKTEPAPAPEPEKPKVTDAPKTLTDSPFEAQAKVYFGELPKPLLTQATEVLDRRHGWQMELRAAESAAQGGDAAARDRVQAAQGALAKVQTALERIEFDAHLAAQAKQQPAPVAQSWGVVARDEVVDAALADRSNWKPEYQALDDYEVAAVLRAVPAGGSPDDYLSRATKALDAFVAKRKPTAVTQAKAAQATPTAQPKNPAPPAPAKPDVTIAGDTWSNDVLPTKDEKMRRIIARARGDAMTN